MEITLSLDEEAEAKYLEVALKVDIEDVKVLIIALEANPTPDDRERGLLAYLRLRVAMAAISV